MIPPEHFHSCHYCDKFTIDLNNKQPALYSSSAVKDIPTDIFFFDATLDDVLQGLLNRCELCSWLDSLWGGISSSSVGRYGVLKAGENASRIVVCAETYSMSLVGRYPVDEILFFGLWEENTALHPHWGRCQVFAKCTVDVFCSLDDAASRFIQNRPINRFPGSAGNLELAQRWLRECQISHAKCRQFSHTYMPLRILRISSPNDCSSCDYHVALETTRDTAAEPFAALSYCWGGDQPYKTTKARMQLGDVSLQWRKLLRSIQDAVKTTVALGLEYLWVDSLCIIQDDDEDKALQIADIARIYSQATVTIIASRASKFSHGFLGEIDLTSQTQLAVRLPFRCPDKDQTVGSAYLVQIDGSRTGSEPIDSRAWTLQERYLSNRILEFGSYQTRWTCATSSASTTTAGSYADGWKWDSNSQGHASQILYLHADLLADLAELTKQRSGAAWVRDHIHSRWQTILGEYTPRLLSVPTDRILGISGVADRFLSHLRNEGGDENEEYLAGMWRSSLPSLLCWHAVAAETAAGSQQQNGRVGVGVGLPPAPTVYQGPSWSWVGVNCQVLLVFSRACDRDCRAALLDVDIKLANASAKCGSVTSAILTLQGKIRRAFWDIGTGALRVDLDERSSVEDEFRNPSTSTMRAMRLTTMYPDTSDLPHGLSEKHGLQAPVWLLEIGNCVGLKKRGPVGLVLDPVDVLHDEAPPRYRRLGLFHTNTKQSKAVSQVTDPSIEYLEIEDEVNFFEGQVVKKIQLE
ncbi:heterokaryon incompatibility protein-domain-containing protein [Nemania sp. FL0916]|nr:heterokaryon incompatibility protein-domain-containing protein [Nemania sp. FL0916]